MPNVDEAEIHENLFGVRIMIAILQCLYRSVTYAFVDALHVV